MKFSFSVWESDKQGVRSCTRFVRVTMYKAVSRETVNRALCLPGCVCWPSSTSDLPLYLIRFYIYTQTHTHIHIYTPSNHLALRSNLILYTWIYQICDWNSRYPAKNLYTFPISLHLLYTMLCPNTLPVLENSKINPIIVSFLHPVFTFTVTGRCVLLCKMFSRHRSLCSPM